MERLFQIEKVLPANSFKWPFYYPEPPELTYNVRKTSYVNGEIKIEYVPFYKVLTTHLAWKSFITNSLILDIPERDAFNTSK